MTTTEPTPIPLSAETIATIRRAQSVLNASGLLAICEAVNAVRPEVDAYLATFSDDDAHADAFRECGWSGLWGTFTDTAGWLLDAIGATCFDADAAGSPFLSETDQLSHDLRTQAATMGRASLIAERLGGDAAEAASAYRKVRESMMAEAEAITAARVLGKLREDLAVDRFRTLPPVDGLTCDGCGAVGAVVYPNGSTYCGEHAAAMLMDAMTERDSLTAEVVNLTSALP